MSFVVTARKYRPQLFKEVVGQEHITDTLINGINNGRIAHAFLFTGPRGVGKTTTARILAKALNCLNPKDAEPCNICEICTSIQSNQSLDIIEIDAASNRGIDDIRTLRDSVKYAPTKGKYKVYIIDEVHMLTKESFNALLKTLEEPPSHTIFIFATTDIHRVPLTIISRCQRYDFRRIDVHTIKSLLAKIAQDQKITIDDKTLTLIAKKSDGGLRDAESFYDQVAAFCGNNIEYETVVKILNFIDDELYFSVSDAIKKKDYQVAFSVAEKIYEHGWSFTDFIEGLIEHFRNFLTVRISGSTSLIETAEVYKERYEKNKNYFTENDILRTINFLAKTASELRYAPNHKLKIEVALCFIIGMESTVTISSLLELLQNGKFPELEKIVANEHPLESISVSSQQNESVEKKEKIIDAVKSVKEEPVIERKPTAVSPRIEKVTVSATEGHSHFDIILNEWDNFVSSITKEKKLLLGKIVGKISPLSLSDSTLSVHINDDFGKNVVLQHHDYFSQKAHEIFGTKLRFNFVDNPVTESNEVNDATIGSKEVDLSGNKVISYIKNQLGGKEVY